MVARTLLVFELVISSAVSRFFGSVATDTHAKRPVLVKSDRSPIRQMS